MHMMLMETEPQKCMWFGNVNATTMHVMILHDILVFVCSIFLVFQKNYMSKKGNWDFLKLVKGRYHYSSLMGWLGSQAGSWDPRKYPSQIPSQLPRKSHIYLTHLLSNNSLIFYLIDSNSKLGYKVCGLQVLVLKFQKNEGHKIDHSSKRRKQ